MTVVIPDGWLSASLEAFAATVASSKTFQTVTGSDNASHALSQIVRGGVYEEQNVPDKTRAIVRYADGLSADTFTDTTFTMRPFFKLMTDYIIPEAYRESYQDSYLWLLNTDGRIVTEMLANSRTGDRSLYANIIAVSQEGEPGIIDPKEMDGEYVGFTTWMFDALGEATP